MDKQISLFDENGEYEEFVNKFKPKKTTDDCYTPPAVYEAVNNWVCERYGISADDVVRPFWPGGDYERFDYAEESVVIDNPPFSILTSIVEFYLINKIKFFLFAPSLTVLSGVKTCMKINHIITDSSITYENGAVVRTAFVTNLDEDTIAETAADLKKAIEDAQNAGKVELPKYRYPDQVVTVNDLQKIASGGVNFRIRKGECVQISKLDSQRKSGKTIFGSGLLVTEKVAAEKVAAEKVAAEKVAAEKVAAEKAAEKEKLVWELSEREKRMIEKYGEAHD